MSESILTSIKKLLGIDESYTHFDADIIMHINSVLATLYQLGLGGNGAFSISGANEIWADFIGNENELAFVKSYIYIKVKLLFDPPLSSAAMDSMSRQADELQWRINLEAECGEKLRQDAQNEP